ncbi:elongin BC and Polycomb repressive complex 2-associated protein-like isoform X1 [Zonotrichia leucophrys gambelii]|uniref:elongin BC and Polycomb repressive complex 2-associated protein-like isoform X1 n=1 Tax=Zonotrichia leucophrys gambelii TaxID=257770 RepID=UPI003140069E
MPPGPLSQTRRRAGGTGPGTAPFAARRRLVLAAPGLAGNFGGGERAVPRPSRGSSSLGFAQDMKSRRGERRLRRINPLRRRRQCSAGDREDRMGQPPPPRGAAAAVCSQQGNSSSWHPQGRGPRRREAASGRPGTLPEASAGGAAALAARRGAAPPPHVCPRRGSAERGRASVWPRRGTGTAAELGKITATQSTLCFSPPRSPRARANAAQVELTGGRRHTADSQPLPAAPPTPGSAAATPPSCPAPGPPRPGAGDAAALTSARLRHTLESCMEILLCKWSSMLAAKRMKAFEQLL